MTDRLGKLLKAVITIERAKRTPPAHRGPAISRVTSLYFGRQKPANSTDGVGSKPPFVTRTAQPLAPVWSSLHPLDWYKAPDSPSWVTDFPNKTELLKNTRFGLDAYTDDAVSDDGPIGE